MKKTSVTYGRRLLNSVYSVVTLVFLCLFIWSCDVIGDRFKVKGRFQNLNQGEFYVYSLDGINAHVDTIRVDKGRFMYEIDCEVPTTLMLVFPNFSEQPIFAEPGESVEVRADASSLRELEVLGTEANALMTSFRKQIIDLSPPKIRDLIEKFVAEHAESKAGTEVSLYLIRRYFMQGSDIDYKKAEHLLGLLEAKQPRNAHLLQLLQKTKSMRNTELGSKMPSFSATDINGVKQTNTVLKGAPLAVVTTFASWHYESVSLMRQLRRVQKKARGNLKIMSIMLDANHKECRNIVDRDSINWPIIFDDKFFDSDVVKAFGFTTTGDNILYQDGRVVEHGMVASDLVKAIEDRLP